MPIVLSSFGACENAVPNKLTLVFFDACAAPGAGLTCGGRSVLGSFGACGTTRLKMPLVLSSFGACGIAVPNEWPVLAGAVGTSPPKLGFFHVFVAPP